MATGYFLKERFLIYTWNLIWNLEIGTKKNKMFLELIADNKGCDGI